MPFTMLKSNKLTKLNECIAFVKLSVFDKKYLKTNKNEALGFEIMTNDNCYRILLFE